jgi:hypothetical protein
LLESLHLFGIEILKKAKEALVCGVLYRYLNFETFTHWPVHHTFQGLTAGHQDATMRIELLVFY